MDDKSFDQGIKILCATYQGFKVDQEKLNLYRILLSDLSGEVFLTAIVKVARTVKELYPGSNLIAIIHEQCNSLVSPALIAEEAWLKVFDGRKKASADKVPDFENEAINNSVRVIGWDSIYYSGFRDFPIGRLERLRSSFIRTYNSYKIRADDNHAVQSAMKLLSNQVLIGDRKQE